MSEILNQIPGPLLQWYDSRARVLPWRSQPTPYRVWVSEIMLQQTRVEAALPYFDRFMAVLPDIAALAQAPETQLLKLWEGLGYYSRVRNLQKAARQVMEQWGGMLPQKLEDLMALPGIGEYSAGAIASIAYGQRVPAVDGNVLRVVSRLLASRENVMDPKVKRQLRQQVWDIIPAQRPGDFNQSLMELGALVCLPNGKPLCSGCPLENLCLGNRLAIAQELPVKPPKKARRVVPRTVFVLCSQGRLLLHRRPSRGLLASLWEFPGQDGHLSLEQAAETLAQAGIQVSSIASLGEHTHIFSHVEWPMVCYQVECLPFPAAEDYVWCTPQQLQEQYALPSAFRPFAQWLRLTP
ncbi:MAG TPA: A/G-specific adenine glycosylase [Firmicutes bacterium]|nr:A/G-specific adenine glycosylase [Bacillota bacterium]